jgi:hypothetical protein
MEQITTIGLDLAKHVFQIHGVDGAGKMLVRTQLRRAAVLRFFEGLPPCLVGMEACGTAHHWARELIKLGHTVRCADGSAGIRERAEVSQTAVLDSCRNCAFNRSKSTGLVRNSGALAPWCGVGYVEFVRHGDGNGTLAAGGDGIGAADPARPGVEPGGGSVVPRTDGGGE